MPTRLNVDGRPANKDHNDSNGYHAIVRCVRCDKIDSDCVFLLRSDIRAGNSKSLWKCGKCTKDSKLCVVGLKEEHVNAMDVRQQELGDASRKYSATPQRGFAAGASRIRSRVIRGTATPPHRNLVRMEFPVVATDPITPAVPDTVPVVAVVPPNATALRQYVDTTISKLEMVSVEIASALSALRTARTNALPALIDQDPPGTVAQQRVRHRAERTDSSELLSLESQDEEGQNAEEVDGTL